MRALLGIVLLSVAGCSIISPATEGPTVQMSPDGWTADPQSIVQTGDWFEFSVTNSLEAPIRFVVLRLDYGDAIDIPTVDGVVDVSRQVLYESSNPLDPGDPVVAYLLVHPGPVGEGPSWNPAIVDSGATTKIQVGNPGLGGGEPGKFVVVSYEPGGFERGDFVIFDMTDEDGLVPQFTLEDFFPPEDR